ncbi:MAG: flagellar basal body rod protein FlgC [Acidimicrobiales bacterium]
MALFGALDAAVSGATVSRVWLDAISDNVANVNTIRSTSEEPFRARMLIVNEVGREQGQPGGVRTVRIAERGGEPELLYDPSHPLADENGNVRRPNVEMSVEMTNLLIANRTYQSNLRVIEIARSTYQSALRIGSR